MSKKPTYAELEQRVKKLERKAETGVQHEFRVQENIFQAIGQPALILNPNHEILAANSATIKISGRSEKDLIGKKCYELFHDTDQPPDNCPLTKMLISGQVETEEIEIQAFDRFFLVSCTPVFGESGEISTIIHIATDITDRKLVEEALRNSERRYRAVVESQTEMICRFLPDGTLTFVNEAYCSYFKKNQEELIGNKFMPLIPDSDQEKVFKNIASLSVNSPIITHEHRVIAPNGEIFWHKWTNRAIFDEQNNLIEYQAIGWDITHRKQAEEALRESEYRYGLIFNRSRDAIFIVGADAKFTDVNDAASDLTGYSKAELKRMSIPDLHEKVDLHAYKTYFKSIMAGEPVLSEAKILRKDGVKVDTEFSNTSIKISGIPFMHTVARDITDRKQTEKALKQAHDELESRVEERTKELELKTKSLRELNTAMKVVLKKREEDKTEVEQSVMANVRELIAPYFDKINETKMDDHQKAFMSILESNLNEIVSPFTRKLSMKYLSLTPKEIQIVNMIKIGYPSKKIAKIMKISPRTVDTHRKNIRGKIGLGKKKANLRSHILAHEQ
jgi:PAS domain S-box-containing protein